MNNNFINYTRDELIKMIKNNSTNRDINTLKDALIQKNKDQLLSKIGLIYKSKHEDKKAQQEYIKYQNDIKNITTINNKNTEPKKTVKEDNGPIIFAFVCIFIIAFLVLYIYLTSK